MNVPVMVRKQLSVFVDNRPGALAQVVAILQAQGIHIFALALAEGIDHGYIRMLTDQPEQAAAALHDANYLTFTREVLVAGPRPRVEDFVPLLVRWGEAGVNLDYAYSGRDERGETILVIRAEPIATAQAIAAEPPA